MASSALFLFLKQKCAWREVLSYSRNITRKFLKLQMHDIFITELIDFKAE